MTQSIYLKLTGTILSTALLLSSCIKQLPCNGNSKPVVSVFSTGFNNPRGLKFGPDRNLYVAEGGMGGTNLSDGKCMQVPSPIGPYKGSTKGGRISWVNANGLRATLVSDLPTTINNLGDISGVSDVAFIGNTLYALVSGGGCSHGVPSVPNGIYRINTNGTHTLVANLSSWLQAHPTKNLGPSKDDFEPDCDWYSMVAVDGYLYAVEANHQEIDRINPSNGDIKRILDFSTNSNTVWFGPTSIVYHNNSFYFGDLTEFPITTGIAKVYKLSTSGSVQTFASGLTTILGVAFDKQDRLYVLETTVGQPFPSAGAGKIIRISNSGTKEELVSGLSFPTAMTYGPDGNLYVSNNGYGPSAVGGGQVLKVDLHTCDCGFGG